MEDHVETLLFYVFLTSVFLLFMSPVVLVLSLIRYWRSKHER